MAIDTSLIQKIRTETGAKIVDCQKALMETNGDPEAAKEWLRKKGIASGAKKVDRTAADGGISVCTQGNKGFMLEINTETDFVAKNKDFLDFSSTLIDLAFSQGATSVETLCGLSCNGVSVEEMRLGLAGKTGENIVVKRIAELSVHPGVVSSYIHNALSPSMGKTGVLVSLQSEADPKELDALGKKIAMHIVATSPQYVRIKDVSETDIDKEKEILGAQIAEQKKDAPEEIRAKMIEGRMRKFFENIVLEEQDFALEPGTKVKDVLVAESKRLGCSISIGNFVMMKLGA